MQAPTTPSGAPAHQPGDRECSACGASNGSLAAFCWQCYRPFGPEAAAPSARPPAGYAGSMRGLDAGMRGPVVEPIPLARPRQRTRGAVAGAVLVAAAVAAGVYFFLNRGPSGAELPTAFGGLTEISNSQVDAAVDTFRAQAEGGGFRTDMGLYGTAGAPSAGLVWVVDPSSPTPDAAFTEFAGGFNEGLGTGTLDESRKTTETIAGVSYLCAPVVGNPPANLCLWEDDDVYWVLFDLSGSQMASTRELAAAAHDAVSV